MDNKKAFLMYYEYEEQLKDLSDEELGKLVRAMFRFEKLGFEDDENKRNFYYRELLPVELNEKIGYSKFLNFIFTNEKLNIDEKSNIYKVEGKNIYYF